MSAVDAAVLSARDFIYSGGDLYVLDWRSDDVAVLRQDEIGHWHVRGRIGRRGHGPGELSRPISMAALDSNTFGVLERSGELEVYGVDGLHRELRRYRLPCSSARPQLLVFEETPLFASSCPGALMGLSADSVYLGLWQLVEGAPAIRLAAIATRTANGEWGSAYETVWPISAGPEHVYFGSGLDGCVLVAPAHGSGIGSGTLSFRESCGLTAKAYAAAAPDGFLPPFGRAFQWPDHLPRYVALMEAGEQIVMLRQFHADSAVFQTHAASHSKVAVAPLGSFVECNEAGCLWYKPGLSADSLGFLSHTRLEMLASGPALAD